MELSELTAYAEEKFHIREQHKWADLPGLSVLADPGTGKWAALLMRQWDFDTGTEIQRCDIRCGRQVLSEMRKPYLSLPYRMRGENWIGVRFDDGTDPEVIFRLFDRAVYSCHEGGYIIVLDHNAGKDSGPCRVEAPRGNETVYRDVALPPLGGRQGTLVPDRIRRMMKLYRHGVGSFQGKCRNFYRQGKFMEDYEDDVPWNGEFRHYFPTYHDLTIRQLRGYFTWRTGVRKGNYTPVALSFAYLYLYELLNGIGAGSPEEVLQKMEEFADGFLDSGMGDPGMAKNLRRWMVEYGVIHDVSPELVRGYADPVTAENDRFLEILRNPEKFTDEEVFSALCGLGGRKLEESPAVQKDGEKGRRLFAAVWRQVSEAYGRDGRDFFAACFGERKIFSWHPLANAVYWEESPHPDADYVLDGCRSYHCRKGVWKEARYDRLYFNRSLIQGLLHAADLELRRYLKTGHYLRRNPREDWAVPYVEAVLEAEYRKEMEAAKPKIAIDFSGLEQIRRDAAFTRDSLLTEEEEDWAERKPAGPKGEPEEPAGEPEGTAREPDRMVRESDGMVREPEEPAGEPEEPAGEPDGPAANLGHPGVDGPHTRILLDLLEGKSPEAEMKAGRLMPSVAADRINEALFDEIGDNVLECDGDAITLVEDYREDILQILGGNAR